MASGRSLPNKAADIYREMISEYFALDLLSEEPATRDNPIQRQDLADELDLSPSQLAQGWHWLKRLQAKEGGTYYGSKKGINGGLYAVPRDKSHYDTMAKDSIVHTLEGWTFLKGLQAKMTSKAKVSKKLPDRNAAKAADIMVDSAENCLAEHGIFVGAIVEYHTENNIPFPKGATVIY